MTDRGLYCEKDSYTRPPLGPKQCDSSSEFINELGLLGPNCFGSCQNGTEHPGIPTCMGSCPAGTTLCGAEGVGTLCLDDAQDCQEYIEDIAEYAVDWTVAITTQNWFDIVRIIAGEHPTVDYPICDDWNDDSV